jgi:uncharacterized protein YebE (UPF0316 family)
MIPLGLLGTTALIFVARLCDVTLSTLRIVLVARGMRRVAPFIGFFEVLIWLIAVMRHLDHWSAYVAYAGGFACGTWIGLYLESKIALGLVAVRVITDGDAVDVVERLREERFAVTDFAARGIRGNVRLLFLVIHRKDLSHLLDLVRELQPKAFISTSDVRSVSEGYLPEHRTRRLLRWFQRPG